MPIRLQADAEGASKQDTRFLGHSDTGSMAELLTDLSQRFTDFANDTTSISEAASARCNVTTQWTILVRVRANNSNTGTLYNNANQRLEVTGSGLVATVNGVAVGAPLALPNSSPSRLFYTLAWVARPNPGTTGASDAVQSWLFAYDESGAESGRQEIVHAARTASAGTARWNAQDAAGTGQWDGDLYDVLFASRCQSLTEIVHDWALSELAVTTETKVEKVPIPLTRTALAANEAHIHGPAAQWAAKFASHARMRAVSPLVNTAYLQTPTIDDGTPTDSATRPYYKHAPGSSVYWMALGWLEVAPVPPWANAAWVRLHVRTWVTGGPAIPMGFRVYSMSRRPVLPQALGFNPPAPMEKYFVSATTERDDVASEGAYVIKATMPIAVGQSGVSLGKTYLCPAFAFDPAGESDGTSAARLQIRALHVIPCLLDDDGQVPLGGLGG